MATSRDVSVLEKRLGYRLDLLSFMNRLRQGTCSDRPDPKDRTRQRRDQQNTDAERADHGERLKPVHAVSASVIVGGKVVT